MRVRVWGSGVKKNSNKIKRIKKEWKSKKNKIEHSLKCLDKPQRLRKLQAKEDFVEWKFQHSYWWIFNGKKEEEREVNNQSNLSFCIETFEIFFLRFLFFPFSNSYSSFLFLFYFLFIVILHFLLLYFRFIFLHAFYVPAFSFSFHFNFFFFSIFAIFIYTSLLLFPFLSVDRFSSFLFCEHFICRSTY